MLFKILTKLSRSVMIFFLSWGNLTDQVSWSVSKLKFDFFWFYTKSMQIVNIFHILALEHVRDLVSS